MKNNLLQNTKITKTVLNLQSKKQNTAYVYLLLTLLTVSFFGFFALRPAFSIIANLQKQLADNKVVLLSLEEKLTALKNLDKEYKQIEPNLELIYEAVPVSPQASALIRQVQKIAQAHNLAVNSLETSTIDDFPLEANNTLYSYQFTITVIGEEKDIQAFLVSLVTFNRAIGLNRVVTDRNTKGAMQANIEGTAYFLPNVTN